MTRHTRRHLLAIPALLAALLVLPACDSGGGEDPDPPPSPDQIFFGVNYTQLFAPPSDAEVAAVRTDWSARNPSSSNENLAASVDLGNATLHVVEHTVTATGGGSITHYGLVHVPDGAADLPVVVVHHGGDNGISATSFLQTAVLFDLAEDVVAIAPVYRSEPIPTDGVAGLGQTYTATGGPSPWDYDVDDSIAFLSGVLSVFGAETDEDRIAAIGFSRGGNVATLQSIRDDRIDAVVDYFGPTDFYNSATEVLATGLLTGSPAALSLPGGQYLLGNVLDPLRNADGTANPNADYATARLEVVRRSSSVFQEDLPDTQVHHHTQDPVVPIVFSQAFADAANEAGGGSFDFFTYNGASNGSSFHSPTGFPESIPVAIAFLQGQLAVGSAAPLAIAE
ncbi:MAG: hypothetical protein AAGK21_00370 [Bacteroidota bacterium]